MNNRGVIYGLFCPVDNRVVYVGQTALPLSTRLSQHKSSIGKPGNSAKAKWLRVLKEMGELDKVLIVTLSDNVPAQKLAQYEKRWIEKLSSVGALVNDTKKTNTTCPRPIDGEGLVCRRQPIPESLVVALLKKVDECGVKAVAIACGVDNQNIRIAMKEMIATEPVRALIENGIQKHIKKRRIIKSKKRKAKIKKDRVRKPNKTASGKSWLRRRPDASEWVLKNIAA